MTVCVTPFLSPTVSPGCGRITDTRSYPFLSRTHKASSFPWNKKTTTMHQDYIWKQASGQHRPVEFPCPFSSVRTQHQPRDCDRVRDSLVPEFRSEEETSTRRPWCSCRIHEISVQPQVYKHREVHWGCWLLPFHIPGHILIQVYLCSFH